MKKLILVLVCTTISDALLEVDIDKEWESFQKQHRKLYSIIGENERRYSIFAENLLKIYRHNNLYNAGNVTYKLGTNQFTDWTSEEFTRYVNKFRVSTKVSNLKMYSSNGNITKIPDSFDWRLHWAVTDVRNQGQCGSCWAFSAAGALEGQAQIALGKRIRLSEQNLLDCADQRYGNLGCDGGDTNAAFLYASKFGIQSEDSYPYVAHQSSCRQSSAELYVVDYYTVSTEEDLKSVVATVGPISVAICATAALQHYSGGVFLDRTCTKHLNHAVLVVGYGTEGGDDYWLVKNSWGSSWGEQGYLKLARNKYNNCGIASYASFPVVSERKNNKLPKRY